MVSRDWHIHWPMVQLIPRCVFGLMHVGCHGMVLPSGVSITTRIPPSSTLIRLEDDDVDDEGISLETRMPPSSTFALRDVDAVPAAAPVRPTEPDGARFEAGG